MSKLEQFVGKVVVRTMPSSRGDRSFMSNPIKIEAVIEGVIYMRWRPKDKVCILEADYNDGHWKTVHHDFVKDTWESR
jgi:hypothetical protein